MAERQSPIAAALRLVFTMALFGGILFLIAGTLAWPAAWGYLAVVTTVMGAYSLIVSRLHPDLADERRRPPSDAKRWDRPYAMIVGIAGPVALILLSGLDRRFHWSPPLPGLAQVAGLVLGLWGGLLTNYAVAANRFFSAVVRIQRDRGHTVVETGPYRWVRHPGYAGSLLYMLGVSFALGSRPAMAATVAVALVLVIRTAREDRTLQAELEGYSDYARRVRYRLVPGVW